MQKRCFYYPHVEEIHIYKDRPPREKWPFLLETPWSGIDISPLSHKTPLSFLFVFFRKSCPSITSIPIISCFTAWLEFRSLPLLPHRLALCYPWHRGDLSALAWVPALSFRRDRIPVEIESMKNKKEIRGGDKDERDGNTKLGAKVIESFFYGKKMKPHMLTCTK